MPAATSLLRDSYQRRLATGDLRSDAAQAGAVETLQRFAAELDAWNHARRQSGLRDKIKNLIGLHHHPKPAGLYIFGRVGRGKSMLMDLFVENVSIERKRRVHFHQFMLEIHARLNELRQKHATDDIMQQLVRGIAADTALLCFDEFHVSNIADAMILGRLFEGLFDAGVTIVSTSNWAPDDLYKNGLQRDRFLPFIAMIRQRMQVLQLDGPTDYRYEQLRNLQSYFSPLGLDTTRKLQGLFFELTHDATPEAITLPVEGRTLTIAQAAHGIGFFNFDELCQRALGAADYLAIAECLHTVILDGVPSLEKIERRNEAIRFMTLIDTLYEAKVKLFMGTALPIEKLHASPDIEGAFQRTISRLMEMQGEAYRLKQHKG